MSSGTPVTGRGRLLRRIVLLAAGSVVSMALGFAALSDAVDLFGRSGDAESPDVATTAPAADAAENSDAAPPAGEGDGRQGLNDVEEVPAAASGRGVYHSRDPFSPVLTEEAAVTNAASETVPAAPPVTDAPVPTTSASPVEPEGPSDPAPSAEGCVPDGDAYLCDGVYVALANVGTDAAGTLRAVLQVDTTVYEAVGGVSLPGGLEVARVTASCVDLRYRDQAFQLCENDRDLK